MHTPLSRLGMSPVTRPVPQDYIPQEGVHRGGHAHSPLQIRYVAPSPVLYPRATFPKKVFTEEDMHTPLSRLGMSPVLYPRTTFPKKVFTEEDMHTPLSRLGMSPVTRPVPQDYIPQEGVHRGGHAHSPLQIRYVAPSPVLYPRTTFPKKVFTEEDMHTPLSRLGMSPRHPSCTPGLHSPRRCSPRRTCTLPSPD